ncbi:MULTISPECIES: hypothetical protein [Streptomyces]|uniref:hypothetical protein n=1 Tax=Streptomyces TaxID=1883 RepID=UPI000A93E968|nr:MULTISPECIES: hypothetical protein [Streptomyces]MCH0558112.1 hypothetical protein [Streptomyces sp. MUM 16J]
MSDQELIEGYRYFVDAADLAASAEQQLPTTSIFSYITTTCTTTVATVSVY